MKILGVIDENPFDPRTWSGISYYFFRALEEKGYLSRAISANLPSVAAYLLKAISFEANMKKWKFRYRINTNLYKVMTGIAKRKVKKIADNDYDVILQIGAWYDMTNFKNKKVVSYHDGNLKTLLKSPYGHPDIKLKYIKKALEHEGNIYKKIDHIFPMSKWLASSFQNDFGIPAKKITPVGAGINLPYVLNVGKKCYDSHKILFIGKDFQRKGGKILLGAFERVKRVVKDANLTMIGPFIENSLLPEGVTCLGPISKLNKEGVELILKEYSSASIFVMPSLYEPFGIVFAEAMAHKLPCIGTNICAMPEIIDDGITGFIVPPYEEEALAIRIIELLKEPEMCREMGEQGYFKYNTTYRWDVVTSKIVETIQAII